MPSDHVFKAQPFLCLQTYAQILLNESRHQISP